MGVVGEMCYGEGLSVRRGVGQQEDHGESGGPLAPDAVPCSGMPGPPNADIGECVVEAEVGVRHEVQCDGDLKSTGDLSSASIINTCYW